MAPVTRIATASPPCPRCGVETPVCLEHVHVGSIAALVWHCVRCHARWPGTDAPRRVASRRGFARARLAL
jgi:hypothetical protein